MGPRQHMYQFLSIYDIYLIEHDDVMVIVFLQTLIGPSYVCYHSLPVCSIGSFDDLENMFMTMYAPHVSYHNLLTQFTQIHLKNGERIKDFNLQFFKTLNQIPKDQTPNDHFILGSYKNAIPAKVNYAIKVLKINDIHASIQKETNMEEFMLNTNVDPEIIL
jgi:hypothetical protein